jgi:hypothetical protein
MIRRPKRYRLLGEALFSVDSSRPREACHVCAGFSERTVDFTLQVLGMRLVSRTMEVCANVGEPFIRTQRLNG